MTHISNSFSALTITEEDFSRAENDSPKPHPHKRKKLKNVLVWIDLEMTGLDIDKDSILQIACIVSDGSLEHIIEGPEIVVNQPEPVLADMNEWCIKHHGESGLTQAVRQSTTTLEEAEQRVLTFVREHAPEPRKAHIAGNSVYVDVAFLRRFMPRLLNHCHHRLVDVSTVGELARRWYRKEANEAPRKANTHTAMSDIRESIAQLKYYKRTIFK